MFVDEALWKVLIIVSFLAPVMAYSSSLLRAIIACSHLSFLKTFSNFVNFWQNFRIFRPFLTFLNILLKNGTHVLTF